MSRPPLAERIECAPQLYSLADLARLLKLQPRRLREMERTGDFPAACIIIPGAGHKAQRWSATTINEVLARWGNPSAASS
jgi:pimeloyl-ACP methyl ester carboxylesterase